MIFVLIKVVYLMKIMDMKKKQYIYFISDEGHIYGIPDYTRLEKAKWYKKILSKVSWKYKKRFEDILAIEVNIIKK